MTRRDWNDAHRDGKTVSPDRVHPAPPAVLGELEKLVVDVGGGVDCSAAWRAILPRIRSLANAPAPHDRTAVDLLTELSTYAGWGSKANGQLTALRSAKREAKSHLRVVDDSDGDHHAYPDLTSALAAAGATAVPVGLQVPPGYRIVGDEPAVLRAVNVNGVPTWREVLPRLMAPVGAARDIESGAVNLTIGWSVYGEWHETTITRSVLSDRATMAALAADGAPIDGSSVAEAQRWLSACENANRGVLPIVKSMARLGWTGDAQGYLLGCESLGIPITYMPAGRGEAMDAQGFKRSGTLDGWLRHVWTPIKNRPPGLVVLASLVPIILPILRQPGWTVDLGTTSSRGKTTSMELACSAWGDRLMLKLGWPTTWAAIRNLYTVRHSHPTFLDDTQHVKDPKHIFDAVYGVSQQFSQVLGSVGGGTQERRPLATVLISSGENSIAQTCQMKRGAMVRMFTMHGAPFPPGSEKLIGQIIAAADEHHGHAALGIIRWLMGHRDRWDDIRASFHANHDRLRASTDDDMEKRILGIVAQIATVAAVATEAIGLDVPTSLLDLAVSWVVDGASDRDVPLAALRDVASWWAARGARVGTQTGGQPSIGHALPGMGDTWRMVWYPPELRRALSEMDYRPTEVLRGWKEAGWIHTTEPGTTTTKAPAGVPMSGRVVLMTEAAMKVIRE